MAKKKALILANRTLNIGNVYYSMANPLKKLGYEVHLASNFNQFQGKKENEDFIVHQIDFIRNPFDIRNIKAYRQLMNLLEKEEFDVIHCNNPISGILGRICGYRLNTKKIIYTAHGFHFYKGAPFINRILYKSVEEHLAKYTDALITINTEDYQIGNQMKLKNNGKCYYVHGVGIETKFKLISKLRKEELIKSLNLSKNAIICIAIGDLNKNKNYKTLIRAFSFLKNSDIHLLICGVGNEKNKLENLVHKCNITKQIHFLGYRNDVNELLQISDIFIQCSYREGLSRSIMEAMIVGLPCIVSRIRGNVDLIDEEKGGFLVEPNNYVEIANRIKMLISNEELRKNMGKYNQQKVQQNDIKNIEEEMKKIYEEVLKEKCNDK